MSCTCCPYGGIPILPILVSFVLLVMTWVSAFACNLFEADRFTAGVTVGYGAWLVQGVTANTGGGIPTQFETLCFPYSSVGFFNANLNFLIDSNMQVARAFSMIAVVLSVPVFIMILMTGCCTTSNHTSYFRLTGGLAGFTGVCQLLTLIALNSEICKSSATCDLGWTGIVCIVGGSVWIVLGMFMCVLPAIVNEPTETTSYKHQQPAAAQPGTAVPVAAAAAPATVVATTGLEEQAKVEQTVTRTANPDGSTTIQTITTTTNPDGSKTVTEETMVERV